MHLFTFRHCNGNLTTVKAENEEYGRLSLVESEVEVRSNGPR